MPATDVNATNFALAREASVGTLPAQPRWINIEPNDVGRFGKRNTLESREPISGDRFERKGTQTDIEAGVEYEEDWTYSAFLSLAEGFVLANFTGPAAFNVPDDSLEVATTSTFGVAADGDLAAGTLIKTRGFSNTENNGTFEVDTGSTTTSIPVVGGGLVVEASPPDGATLEVCGFRGASADLEIDASQNLISTALDFTTLGLTVGQLIHIGGVETANRFATADNFGVARITAIAANEITLTNRTQAYSADAGTGKRIDILFGRFLRPVAATHGDFNRISHAFEATYPTLGSGSTARYEYVRGGVVNTITMRIPLTAKCGLSWVLAATTADDLVASGSRETNAADAADPVATEALSSSIDIGRLRFHSFDDSGFGSCFKSLDIELGNNVTPDKCIGTLGANDINVGTLNVRLTTEIVFTDEAVINALNNNTDVSLDVVVRNDDGGVGVDLPSMNLGGGDKNFPRNETVRVNLEGRAFKDSILGYPVSFSLFPIIPRS